jgi:hypothetical protein
MTDCECKTLDGPAPTLEGLAETRCEVPVRILWILCAASTSLKTRPLGFQPKSGGKTAAGHVSMMALKYSISVRGVMLLAIQENQVR